MNGALTERIKKLDSFAKVHDEFQKRTFLGGLVSLFGIVLALLLLSFEVMSFVKVDWKSEMRLDTKRKDKMLIHFDITFFKVPCFALTLDLMNAAEQYQNNIEEGVYRNRIDAKGFFIDTYQEFHKTRSADYCGSCYKADVTGADGKPVCCNSCSSVFAAYEHKGIDPPKMEDIAQCVEEDWPQKIKNYSGEGCRIHGKILVGKVAGNFHFAPGRSFDAFNYHLHDIRFLDGMHLDFSHKIHHLSFGKHHPTMYSPLNNRSNLAESPEQSFKYLIKVVGSEFQYLNGDVEESNQYVVTHSETHKSKVNNSFPSVFFYYEISPMLMTYKEYRKSTTSFLTGVCAIIGGVYTICFIIEAVLNVTSRRLRRKTTLGKLN